MQTKSSIFCSHFLLPPCSRTEGDGGFLHQDRDYAGAVCPRLTGEHEGWKMKEPPAERRQASGGAASECGGHVGHVPVERRFTYLGDRELLPSVNHETDLLKTVAQRNMK